MSKVGEYRAQLQALPPAEWETFLKDHSNLPGPRGNLELVQAAADTGTEEQFRRWLAVFTPETAPTNTRGEFPAVCGTVGLGRLLAEGDRAVLPDLRDLASDPRWRVREGVAMALQRWGDADMDALLREMNEWAKGSFFVQRAITAGLCEPRLLRDPAHAAQVLTLLDQIMRGVIAAGASERKSEGFSALQKALGYGWSVAIVAHPEVGKRLFSPYLTLDDAAARWIVRENLKKARLLKMDIDWVMASQATVG